MMIEIGDIVTWRSGKSKARKTLPIGVGGCEVVGFSTSGDGRPTALVKLPAFMRQDVPVAVYVDDLEK